MFRITYTPSDPDPDHACPTFMDNSTPKSSTRFVVVGILLGIPMLLCLGMGGWWFARRANQAVQLERRQMELLARGMPIDDQTLTDFRSRTMDQQKTIRWTRVLNQLDSDEFKESCATIPVVGVPPDESPFVPGKPYPHESEVRDFLTKWQPLLAELHDITEGTEAVWTEIQFDSLNTLLPLVPTTRRATRLLTLEFQDAIRRDAPGDVFHSLMATIGVARSLEHEPLFVSQLVHSAVLSVALRNLKQAIELDLLDEQQLLALLDQLVATDDYGGKYQVAIAGERALAPSAAADFGPGGPLALLDFFERAEGIETDDLREFLVKTQQLDRDIETEYSQAGWLRQLETQSAKLLTPAFGSFCLAQVRTVMEMRIAKLAIGIRWFQIRHGRSPNSLDELIADPDIDLGKTVALGPKPFGYRANDTLAELWGFIPREADDSTPQTPVTLQSVGVEEWEIWEYWYWKLPIK